MLAKLYKTEKENYVLVDPAKGTYDDGYMLGTSRESQYNKLSIKNCEAIELGYDLDELADEYYKQFDNLPVIRYNAYTAGFQKALEVNSDKRFTLKEMVECWNKVLTFQDHKETLGEYVQSLQQTEWDVEVEMECVMGCQNLILNGENSVCCGDKKPKLDPDGCLILRRMSPDSSN